MDSRARCAPKGHDGIDDNQHAINVLGARPEVMRRLAEMRATVFIATLTIIGIVLGIDMGVRIVIVMVVDDHGQRAERPAQHRREEGKGEQPSGKATQHGM